MNIGVSNPVFVLIILTRAVQLQCIESNAEEPIIRISRDIKLMLDAAIVVSQTGFLVMIDCATETMPFQCIMEILRDNSTVQSMRFSNGRCYDKNGRPGMCSCSEESTSFHWNFTTSSVQINESFGCCMRIYNSKSTSYYKVYSSVVYNGTVFTPTTSFINPVKTATKRPGTKLRNSTKVTTIIGISVAVFMECLVFATSVIIYYIYNRKKKDGTREQDPNTNKDDSTIDTNRKTTVTYTF